jgi:hypothetical protein
MAPERSIRVLAIQQSQFIKIVLVGFFSVFGVGYEFVDPPTFFECPAGEFEHFRVEGVADNFVRDEFEGVACCHRVEDCSGGEDVVFA